MLLLGCKTAAAPTPTGESEPYTFGPKSRDGIGKFYEGREISQLMGHLGAGWLERPSREREEKPAALVKALGIKPDAHVADIGAGTGYFTFRIAPEVPEGRVLAVDIQPEMLARIEQRAQAEKLANVVPVLGTVTDPKLPPCSIDLALMVDAYHEFSHPFEMMTALRKALKPRGRVVLVEYRGEEPGIMIKRLHKMTEAQVKKEMARVGLRHKETHRVLPTQHIMIFQNPVP